MSITDIEYTALIEIKDYLQQLTYRFSIGDPSFFENSNLYSVIARRLVEISTEIERLKAEVASLKGALSSCDPTGYDGHAETCVVCGEKLYYYNPDTKLDERKPHKPDCLWVKAHEVVNANSAE